MAETLAVLIRLTQRKVETLQKALNATRTAIAEGRKAMESWAENGRIAFAEALADGSILALQQAGAFGERVKQEIAALKAKESALQEDEKAHQKALQEAFGTQKRYELLRERQQQKARRERDKKAQSALDEVAGRM